MPFFPFKYKSKPITSLIKTLQWLPIMLRIHSPCRQGWSPQKSLQPGHYVFLWVPGSHAYLSLAHVAYTRLWAPNPVPSSLQALHKSSSCDSPVLMPSGKLWCVRLADEVYRSPAPGQGSPCHPSEDSPGLGVCMAYWILPSCQLSFSIRAPREDICMSHFGCWCLKPWATSESSGGSKGWVGKSPDTTTAHLWHWLGCCTLDLASPPGWFIPSVYTHLLNGLSSGDSNATTADSEYGQRASHVNCLIFTMTL